MQFPKIWNWLALIFLIGINTGCDDSLARFEQDMSGECWNLRDTLELAFDNPSPDQQVRIAAPITFTDEYPFKNLHLRMEAISPAGEKSTLPYAYDLMDVGGNWYGEVSGSKASFNLPLSIDQVFPEQGVYRFRIYHFMQSADLCGITSAGIAVFPGEK